MSRPTPGSPAVWYYRCLNCGATTQRPYHAPKVECGLCGRMAVLNPPPDNAPAESPDEAFAAILRVSYTDQEASYIGQLESLFAV